MLPPAREHDSHFGSRIPKSRQNDPKTPPFGHLLGPEIAQKAFRKGLQKCSKNDTQKASKTTPNGVSKWCQSRPLLGPFGLPGAPRAPNTKNYRFGTNFEHFLADCWTIFRPFSDHFCKRIREALPCRVFPQLCSLKLFGERFDFNKRNCLVLPCLFFHSVCLSKPKGGAALVRRRRLRLLMGKRLVYLGSGQLDFQ